MQQDNRRVIVIPDIHGEFDMLMELLEKLEFDKESDLLIFLGDLIDRGPKSLEVVKFVVENDFPCVLGNHEQLWVDSYNSVSATQTWALNGGYWALEVGEKELQFWASHVQKFPLYLEVETDAGSTIGLVHAQVPKRINDWDVFKHLIDSNCPYTSNEAVWGRSRVKSGCNKINNVDLVIAGHTVLDSPTTFKNCLFLDAGATFYGKLYAWVLEPGEVKGKIVC